MFLDKPDLTDPTDPFADPEADMVATVLYLSPFTPDHWRLLNDLYLCEYVATVAEDPQFRISEVCVLVTTARLTGTLAYLDRWIAARAKATQLLAFARA